MSKLFFLIALYVLAQGVVFAQSKNAGTKNRAVVTKRTQPPVLIAEGPEQSEKKVRDIVSFLAYILNTLGSKNTSARDKDVLITESYSKIFRDKKVQVEDDLIQGRSTATNKDIASYLKDINFFFKEAKFEFNIDKIDRGATNDNLVFYKVSLHRNLTGTLMDGTSVNNNEVRFIEINFNPKDQDLKIVSIYTHELDPKAAMLTWWKELSHEWQEIFRKKLQLADSVSFIDLQRVVSIENLDLSHNPLLQAFEPLAQLKNLKALSLSSTRISDLSSIRNLTELKELDLSNTFVSDLQPLKYSAGITKLNLENTKVTDLSILQRMPNLQLLNLSRTNATEFSFLTTFTEMISLNLKSTQISELSPVANMTKLIELNISKTKVKDLEPLKASGNLEVVSFDSTSIQNLSALINLRKLRAIHANNTRINDLSPLQGLVSLEKIYCDQTQIKKKAAEDFMSANPKVTVVYDPHDLNAWWSALSTDWKSIISKEAKINPDPSNEELARVGNIDSINISGSSISDLEPLRKFEKLRALIANKSSIHDLSPISHHKEIRLLNISETKVTDISAVGHLKNLKILKADRCRITDIEPLQKLPTLERLYVDETTINDINAAEFLETNPKCLLIYKTVHLNRWWRNLSEVWRNIFLEHIGDTTRESLHKLAELKVFHVRDAPITDLSGLSEFICLRELYLSGTLLIEVNPVEKIKSLHSLHVSGSPIQNIESLGQLSELEDLDISNTPLEDLTPIWTLRKLKKLNCSGTQIKHLNALEKLETLEYLDCSNTNVNKLSSLDYLHLKTFKCYNTKISNRTIENFIASHPQCKVVYYR